VLFYPSGFNISLVGAFLEKELNKAWRIFHFKQIVVVAHSMGGLVTRSFINQYQGKEKTYNIEKYITLSTPWNGHGAAGMGIQYAPTVIPVWEDVAPGSDFLETLFKQPLASETHHHLLFGFRGNSMFAGGNSDGVISIASQLRWEAQNGADRIYGFDEDHMSILQSSKAIKLINEVLKQ
jgi:pimeloyl-ACP methyl ester carboxylesterase